MSESAAAEATGGAAKRSVSCGCAEGLPNGGGSFFCLVLQVTPKGRPASAPTYQRDCGYTGNNVTLDCSRPGKPTDNPFIESFNGSFRDECLNTRWFLSLEDACQKINHWVNEYDNFRPHSSLNEMTPEEFISNHQNIIPKREVLPEASLYEATYFAAAEHTSTASENTYLHKEILHPSHSPKSPT